MKFVYLIATMFALGAGMGQAFADDPPHIAGCHSRIIETDINAIVRGVFEEKFQELATATILPSGFWSKNKDLTFVICLNRGSYDTFVLYGNRIVVFDYRMLAFLMSQSRALIIGQYISPSYPLDIHADLVTKFVEQGATLNDGPLGIIEKKAIASGLDKAAYDKMISDPEFTRREQAMFLQALYFLSMHERCHVALDHGIRLKGIENLPNKEKFASQQEFEIEADRCALDIINADEAQYKGSPVSFFGALMIIATQSIISSQPTLKSDQSHPSTRKRLSLATARIMQFISKGSDPTGKYQATVKGTAEYFDLFLQKLPNQNRN